MKKIFNFAAALAVMVTVSCNKEMNPSEGVSPEGNTVKVTMNATAGDPMSKMLLNGNQFEWKEGDKVSIWFSGATSAGALTSTSAGSAVTFTGELTGLPSSKANLYTFYSKDGSHYSAAECYKDFATEQTGYLSDLDNHAFFGVWVTTDMQTATNDNSGKLVSVEFNATMLPKFSVVKFNVPEELALTEIDLEAESYIAGRLKIYLARKPNNQNGTVGSSCHIYRPNGDVPQSKTIKISRNGVVISGDVYVVVAPDIYETGAATSDTSYDKYCCSTKTLKFTFKDSDEKTATYSATLKSPIHMGELKDLGTIPTDIMKSKVEAGELCLTDASVMTVGVANANTQCTYYYEVGATADECPTPTTASTQFVPSEGFSPVISGTFDRYFIKVLAHTEDEEYRDVIMRASLRHWKFSDGSPVRTILSPLTNTELEPGFVSSTTDGIEVYNTTFTSEGAVVKKTLNYEETSVRIAYSTCYVQLNVTTEYASDLWMSFFVDKNTCVSGTINSTEDTNSNGVLDDGEDSNGNGELDVDVTPNQRGYRLFYNNSGSTTNYWNESVYSEYPFTTNIRYNLNAHISEKITVKAGDKFGLRGDGKHVFYSMAMLEVL